MDSKTWWQSKTIIGGIIAAIGAIGDMLVNGPSAANFTASFTALAGAAFAIYGRYVATTTIKPIISS